MLSELDVIGLGENSVDRVLVVPQLPGAPGAPSKMRVGAAIRSCGGQVATTMAACSEFGLRAAYCGRVGDDDDGRRVRETLISRGVGVTHLHVAPAGATRWATVLVDAGTGERSVLWHRDAAMSMSPEQIDRVDVGAARLIHVDDSDLDGSVRLARAARAAGRLVTTDVDAAEDAIDLVKLATHPLLSEHALGVLSGNVDPERGLRTLRKRCDGVLTVTLGARGAMALADDILVTVPGIPVSAVDTTGAGDVFRAGFIHSLLAGRSLADTLTFANAAAALSCTHVGAISGIPTLKEIEIAMSK